jgi:diguanylate cyclase (GGDEF)-like protein
VIKRHTDWRVLGACLVAGLLGASSFVATVTHSTTAFRNPATFFFFLVTMAVLQTMPLRLVHGRQAETLQLEEAFFIPMALMLTPVETLVVLGTAVAFAHVLKRRDMEKTVFNVGQMVTVSAIGLALSRVLGAATGSIAVRSVLAATAGGVAFAVCSSLAVAAIITIASRSSFVKVIADGIVVRLATWAGSLSLGVLIVVATHASPWVLPISLLPLAGLQLGYNGVLGQWRERQRMEELYEAAIAIRSSMEPVEVREQLATAARHLLEAVDAHIVEVQRAPIAGGLRAEIDANLVIEVTQRQDGGAWKAGDEKLLLALAGVASGALHNAELFEQVKHQALYDALTGLPNLVLFEDRVGQALARARRSGEQSAILFLDLDGFKKVNDSLGHTVGNELLQQVAERLASLVRAQDTVARMGGDEFTVLLSNLDDTTTPQKVADRILDAFRQPFHVGRQELFISPSMGIAIFPHDGSRYETLLKNADSAMHRAKERGKNCYQLYASGMNATAHARLAMEAELHNAIARDELRVLYQPQIDLHAMRVSGAEALVRWQHPKLGMVSPVDFIPLAEETGLIELLDAWVMRRACEQGKIWADAGMPLRISANVSARNFQHGRLYNTVVEILEETGLDPHLLEIEVTESVAVLDASEPLLVLARLKELGIRVAIDDFGTGYSMLSRLHDFPVDTLKIDKSFVQAINEETDQAPIVAAVITLAHGLELDVLAEGVETVDQLTFLRGHGCDSVQGFLFSRPVEPEAVEDLFRRGPSALAALEAVETAVPAPAAALVP